MFVRFEALYAYALYTGYTGIYVLNSTVISAGTNLNQPLWETFGITNSDFTVCDSVLGTPLNVTAFDDLNTVGCTFSDSYPARSIKLQSPLSLPTGTYTIILAASSCDGSGAKSGPLTLIGKLHTEPQVAICVNMEMFFFFLL